MFCSKCGKTLKPGTEVCSCGQPVGAGRFDGVPYTSAQPRIAPEADAAQDALHPAFRFGQSCVHGPKLFILSS